MLNVQETSFPVDNIHLRKIDLEWLWFYGISNISEYQLDTFN